MATVAVSECVDTTISDPARFLRRTSSNSAYSAGMSQMDLSPATARAKIVVIRSGGVSNLPIAFRLSELALLAVPYTFGSAPSLGCVAGYSISLDLSKDVLLCVWSPESQLEFETNAAMRAMLFWMNSQQMIFSSYLGNLIDHQQQQVHSGRLAETQRY